MMSMWKAGALALVLSLAAGSASAQSSGGVLGSQAADIVFSEVEKRIMKDYFGIERDDRRDRDWDGKRERYQRDDYGDRGHKRKKDKGKKKGLPPGLAKKDQLPPGLARQLERKGTLPPGLAKRDLPHDLGSRLPPPLRGTERKIVGNDVVLLEAGTNLILDVLHGVLTGKK